MCYYGQILWAHFISPFINRDLEKQRESSASNIAKKKQEAEAAVSIWTSNMAVRQEMQVSWATVKKSHASQTKELRWD